MTTYVLLGPAGVGKSYLVEELTGLRGLSQSGCDPFTKVSTPYPVGDITVWDTPGWDMEFDFGLRTWKEPIIDLDGQWTPIIVGAFNNFHTVMFESPMEALAGVFVDKPYIVIVNKFFKARRGVVTPEECAETTGQQITEIIGSPPVKVLIVEFNGTLNLNQL